jgi:hypothetical protein
LWEDFNKKMAFLEMQTIHNIYNIIAISQYIDKNLQHYKSPSYKTNPVAIVPEWKLLGYDVSDQYLLSGLMNAGYTSEEYLEFQLKWRKHLNEYHLFSNLDIAKDFVQVTDKRVFGHIPFSIYGIYEIASVT